MRELGGGVSQLVSSSWHPVNIIITDHLSLYSVLLSFFGMAPRQRSTGSSTTTNFFFTTMSNDEHDEAAAAVPRRSPDIYTQIDQHGEMLDSEIQDLKRMGVLLAEKSSLSSNSRNNITGGTAGRCV